MMKTVFLIAFTVNVFVVSIQGNSKYGSGSGSGLVSSSSSSSQSSSSSSKTSASSSSSSSSSTSSGTNQNGNCGKNKCKGPHEVYDECPAPCPPRRCDVNGASIKCAPPPKLGDPTCKPGCRCADNYFRNDKDICVLKEQCPKNKKCKRPNEVYDLCPAKCPFRTCGIDDRLIDCRPSPTVGDPDCPPPACRCANGYYRDDKGNCVEWDKCPKCNNPNEEYDACPAPCPAQRCDVDETLILCAVSPQLGDPQCKPGCRCSDNHVRNEEGICIPKDQCPNKPICKENEVFSNCTQAICRVQDCSQKGKPVACASIAEGSCIKGCVCAPNFLRDKNGDCIPEDKCEDSCAGDPNATPGCGVNCGRLCSNYKAGGQIACPLVCNVNGCDCKEGFVLNTDTGKCVLPGQCPKSQDYCGGDPNAKPGCGINCGRLCSNYKNGNETACIDLCKEDGCDCKEGYVLDTDADRCVLPDQCPNKNQCNKPNEEYQQCPDCSPGTCESIGRIYDCPLQPSDSSKCTGACRCKSGYYYNKLGDCITEEQCKGYVFDTDADRCVLPDQYVNQCNKQNEEYQQCPGCSPGTCESIGQIYPCPLQPSDPSKCTGACRCKSGYYYNKLGDCITEKQCLQCKGPHEYFSCGSACDNVCATLDKQNQTNCPIINIKCNDMCYCEEGYARDDNNICVPINQCKPGKCTGPNEFFTCGPECDNVCATLDTQNRTNCPIINIQCNNKCYCKDGYARDENNVCVPVNQCKPDSCAGDPNATPGCGVNCGRLCSNYNAGGQIACPLICNVNGCDCKEGFVLNTDTGKCVLPGQCPKSQDYCGGDPNAKPGCGINCGRLCSNYKNGNETACIDLCKEDGCDCKEGYVLDTDSDRCVLPDQCPNENQCNKPNEEYQQCPNCSPGTCESIGQIYHCPLQPSDPSKCTGACRCKSGYYYNKLGNCITEEQCMQCKGPHEYFSCGSACDNVCATLDKQNQTNCPIINIKCNDKCYCEEGYARDKNNICVPIDQCKPGKCTGPNEFFTCGPECDNVCATLDTQNRTNCPIINIQCNNKCYCKDGYARDENNVCVPVDQCKPEPKSCGGDPNAKPGCGVNCGRLCSNYKIGDQIACAAACNVNGCDCKEGFVLDTECGKCVLPEKCPKSQDYCGGDPNAKPGCGVNCGRLCSNYKNSTDVACIQICYENGCDCKEGYVLNSETGTCVLPEQCPSNQCTKPNEEYQECANCSPGTCDSIGKSYSCPAVCKGACRCKPGYYYDKNGDCVTEECCGCKKNERCSDCPDAECVAQTCKDVGFPVSCPRFAAGRCPSKPGCVCDSGYYRNSKGVCVPGDQCPSCGGDPNARPGCGTNCGRLCSNYNHPGGVACSDVCDLNGCDCKDGYVYDTNTRKCVLPKKCTKPCGQDEVYSDCVNGGCDKRNCSQLNEPQICIDPVKCEGGCICRKGYLRYSNGVCVPQDQCETTPKCSENEVLSNCIEGLCQIQDCSQKGQEISCAAVVPDVCTKGCICAKNHLRNSKGICVPEDKCDVPTCSENEVFSNCIEGVCQIQDCSQKGQEISCAAVVPDVCTKGCLCAKNYLRNSKGICVHEDQCEVCPEGETFSDCPPVYRKDCDSEYCPKSRNDPSTCPTTRQCGTPKCVCGLLDKRNRETGKCVRASDCPPFPCDGPNEEYQSCPAGCPGENCTDFLENTKCPKVRIGIVVPCKPACRCLEGFYRNSKGICVDSCECTECPDGEVYSKCPPTQCDAEYCPKSRDDPLTCPTPKKCTRPRCICGFNSHRDRLTGKCIPTSKCPAFPCDGKNEVFDSCPPVCPGQNCTDFINKTTCPKTRIGIVVPCKPACRCEKNKYRNSKGNCVCGDECECDE